MAELRRTQGDRCCILQPEHLIGRGAQCALRLEPKYVSSQHALIRWQGTRWELIDRGSRNGTLLNGELIEPGRGYALSRRSTIAFGHPDETWTLTCAAEPQALVTALDTGEIVLGIHGVIGLPSSSDPHGSVYRGLDGSWQLEYTDGVTMTIRDGDTIEVAGRSYRFHCPIPVGVTAASEHVNEASQGTLEFLVSRDEEFVELTVAYPRRRVPLGCRAHNYLLLTLARERVKDAEQDIDESACGWRTKEELGAGLRMTPQQVDGEVFRIRRHFGQHDLPESARIIERRARTRQLRLGIRNVSIKRV